MLLRMHESAFEEWEGVPEEIRYDQNRFNDSLLRRARHDRPSSIPSNLAARAGTDQLASKPINAMKALSVLRARQVTILP